MDNFVGVWLVAWKALFSGFAGAQVSDEVLWMNGGTWAQLLSGIIGSVAGAIAAIWVAMHVLRKTLKEQATIALHNERVQRELAGKQLDEQREALERQLIEQRRGLERQLAEQKAGLELQLQEQRNQAKIARLTAAVTDLMSAASEMRPAHLSGATAILELHHRANAASMRLLVEDLDAIGVDEIMLWPAHLSDLARDAHHVAGTKAEKVAFDRLNEAASTFTTWLVPWVHGDSEMRQEIKAVLGSKRAEIQPKKEWFAEMWSDRK